jgi:hypothetical protein
MLRRPLLSLLTLLSLLSFPSSPLCATAEEPAAKAEDAKKASPPPQDKVHAHPALDHPRRPEDRLHRDRRHGFESDLIYERHIADFIRGAVGAR